MKFDINLEDNFIFKVGSHEISVEFLESNSPILENKSDDYVFGLWDLEKRKIYIKKDLPFSLKFSTLTHEIFHVFEDLYSIRISHKDLNLLADLFSGVFVETFKDEVIIKNKKSKEK